ncbi:hypothetical protein FYL16_08090 [Lactobacillus salivarius]|uniref:hypothetical protein n=1 Tax=Ligilactobacillus salivarius TaxID=1624 RepID=UPI00136884B8|nr:hypothetical protein [Ligilactobacillus salivarius]MDE1523296.1 hypothetical protein [Ligilactobacillus salivarius]MYY93242.1 hypothetical protein [Ligilactobacillus salivarius]MYZ05736.1 hypothetical protein [Ligilactobacillus salivarius]
MNENFINMYTELNRKYPDIYGRDLRIDAVDLKGNYDDDDKFDETLLDKLRIYYKEQIITITRYDRDNWEIEDYAYLKFEDFREIGKILSIVMKHISRIELD